MRGPQFTAFHDINWVAGGKAEDGGIAPLFERVAHAHLICALGEAFAKTLAGRVPHSARETLDAATAKAAALIALAGC